MSDESSQNLGITVLGSGSSGNCTVIHNGTEALMIDAGFSCREMKKRLQGTGLENLHFQGVLVTHEHDDHVKGLRVCAQALQAPIFAARLCAYQLKQMDPKLNTITSFLPGETFRIGQFQVSAFSLSHDAKDTVGYVIERDNQRIAVVTDLGYVSNIVVHALQGCQIMMVESNHDLNMLAASSRPWNVKQRIMGRIGHLSNEASGELLSKTVAAETHQVILAHISHECNTSELAMANARHCLDGMGRNDISLTVAMQNQPLNTIWA